MTDNTSIEWTDASWNPFGGCERVSEGCRHCFAEIMAARFSQPGQWGHGLAEMVRKPDGTVDHRWTGKVQLNAHKLTEPLRWKKPRRIFVNSTSDTFHESVPNEWLDQVFAVMALCPQHVFQVLTKRPERAARYLQPARAHPVAMEAMDITFEAHRFTPHCTVGKGVMMQGDIVHLKNWPLPNVWLGTSVENQKSADERIPHLLATPAAVRWISAEPLLGPVDLTAVAIADAVTLGFGMPWLDALRGAYMSRTRPYGPSDERGPVALDWVVVGGESGPDARPMHPDWARALRDQCAAASVPFFFKQWGAWLPLDAWDPRINAAQIAVHPNGHFLTDDEWIEGAHRMALVGKAAAGRLLDGIEHNAMPGGAA